MSKKFKLRKDLKLETWLGTAFRIEALKDFGDVKQGDLGGYLAKEDNLSHEGFCWVFGDARVFGNVYVFGDACVEGSAIVSGDARVEGSACVEGNARVFGDACVGGSACVEGNARVFGDARVEGSAIVSGNAHVEGSARVFGNARVEGNARVYGNACFRNEDEISNSEQFVVLQMVPYSVTVTYSSINIGCESFTLDQLDSAIQNINYSEYELILLKSQIENALELILTKMSKD